MQLFPAPDEPQLARDALKGLGRAIVGGLGVAKRRPNDFYPTPPEAVRALLRVEGVAMQEALHRYGGPVWEPCGRGGAIICALRAAGFDVVGTDIVADMAHGVMALNLLDAPVALGQVVLTNPPFALAAEMITHLLGRLRVPWLALLLKTTFWSAARREALLAEYPVSRRYDLNWRLDFTGGGSPTMECSWFVWDAAAEDALRWGVLSSDAGSAVLL